MLLAALHQRFERVRRRLVVALVERLSELADGRDLRLAVVLGLGLTTLFGLVVRLTLRGVALGLLLLQLVEQLVGEGLLALAEHQRAPESMRNSIRRTDAPSWMSVSAFAVTVSTNWISQVPSVAMSSSRTTATRPLVVVSAASSGPTSVAMTPASFTEARGRVTVYRPASDPVRTMLEMP